MRVLFDQATPVPLRTFLTGHTVRTTAQQQWDTLKNGELLTVPEEAGFEVSGDLQRRCGLNLDDRERWAPARGVNSVLTSRSMLFASALESLS